LWGLRAARPTAPRLHAESARQERSVFQQAETAFRGSRHHGGEFPELVGKHRVKLFCVLAPILSMDPASGAFRRMSDPCSSISAVPATRSQ
jgi:hypothetical protein